jgi:phospholipase C
MMGQTMIGRVVKLGLAGALAIPPLLTGGAPGAAQNQPAVQDFNHVFIIMMENTSYSSLIGNPNAPWINQAAGEFGLATDYHGVSHPSQPNYIAATSGSTNGVAGDEDVTIDVPNVVDQLEAQGKTWKAYMQSLSLCNGNKLAHACGNQLYERKHNPFVSYQDVQSNPARMANIVDFSRFSADINGSAAPEYVWISPDQCNDMHGRFTTDPNDLCGFAHEQALIAAGDAFLHDTVHTIMDSAAWAGGSSAIIITWDESDYPFADTSGCCDAVPGGGHVVTLVISHSAPGANQSSVPYNHYSLLSTIEVGWGLGCLKFTCDTANVTAMADLVGAN